MIFLKESERILGSPYVELLIITLMKLFSLILEKKLFYLLLMPLFFLLHGYNESFGLVPPQIIFRLFLLYFAITISIILINLVLFKDSNKAGLFSLYLLSLYFLFGAVHDFLKSQLPDSFFITYTFLLSLIFGMSVLLF